MSYQRFATALGVNQRTAQAYLDLLETLFLVRRLPAYSSNLLSRVVKAPKGFVTDTGLLAYLIGADESRIVSDGDVAGPVFETFTAMELLRQAEWQKEPVRLYHYRDRDQREVDLVLERQDGSVVGVEVKAAASVGKGDFKGLRHLRDKLGDRFRGGALIYTGPNTLSFGDRLFAVPIAGLWS